MCTSRYYPESSMSLFILYFDVFYIYNFERKPAEFVYVFKEDAVVVLCYPVTTLIVVL